MSNRNTYYIIGRTGKYTDLFVAYDNLPTEKKIQNIDDWLDRWILLNERSKIIGEYTDTMCLKGFKNAFSGIESEFLYWLQRNPAYLERSGIRKEPDLKEGNIVEIVCASVYPLVEVPQSWIEHNIDIMSKNELMRYAYDESKPVEGEFRIKRIKDNIALVEKDSKSKTWFYNISNLELVEEEEE